MIICATFVFYAEMIYERFDENDKTWYYKDDAPKMAGEKAFFQSIPHALYYFPITVTTTGYGSSFLILIFLSCIKMRRKMSK